MNIKEITIGTFLKFAGKIGFKSSKIKKIIAMYANLKSPKYAPIQIC